MRAKRVGNCRERSERKVFWKILHFLPNSSKLRSEYLFSFQKRTDYLFPIFSSSEYLFPKSASPPPPPQNQMVVPLASSGFSRPILINQVAQYTFYDTFSQNLMICFFLFRRSE